MECRDDAMMYELGETASVLIVVLDGDAPGGDSGNPLGGGEKRAFVVPELEGDAAVGVGFLHHLHYRADAADGFEVVEDLDVRLFVHRGLWRGLCGHGRGAQDHSEVGNLGGRQEP